MQFVVKKTHKNLHFSFLTLWTIVNKNYGYKDLKYSAWKIIRSYLVQLGDRLIISQVTGIFTGLATLHIVGRNSAFGVVTRCGLNCLGIESLWRRVFRTRLDRPWGPPSLLYDRYRFFPVGKAAYAWLWLPTTSSAEVKERVELYLYSTSGPSWPVIGWLLPSPCT